MFIFLQHSGNSDSLHNLWATQMSLATCKISSEIKFIRLLFSMLIFKLTVLQVWVQLELWTLSWWVEQVANCELVELLVQEFDSWRTLKQFNHWTLSYVWTYIHIYVYIFIFIWIDMSISLYLSLIYDIYIYISLNL